MTSPDLIGKLVKIDASDHPYSGKEGRVIRQEKCWYCEDEDDEHGCGYDMLIIQLPSGAKTNVYEPEANLVPSLFGDG